MAFTYRIVKGAPLTHAEVDENFETVEEYYTGLEAEADTQIARVTTEGSVLADTEISRVTTEGSVLADTEISRVTTEGSVLADTEISRVTTEGDTQVGLVKAEGDTQVANVISSGARSGFKNQIINGNFLINQRDYSSTPSTEANQYFYDRWRIVVSGEIALVELIDYYIRVTAPAGGIEQEIEWAALPTGTYTISWEGTAVCTVDGTPRLSGDSFTIANTFGKTVIVKFSGGTVYNAQLEAGSVATPFEQRPIGVESNLCHRYYVHTIPIGGSGYADSSGQTGRAFASTAFPNEMRVLPTLKYTSTGGNMSGSLDGVVTRTLRGCVASQTSTASGSVFWNGTITLDAEL